MSSNWVEMELGDFIELKRGYDLPKNSRNDGRVPIISSSGESGCHDVAKAIGPGVVTGRYGTIGEVYFVEEDYWPLNTTLYVRDFKGNNPLFVYYFLKTVSFNDYSDKAAVPGVNRNHLHKAKIRVPTDPEVQKDIALRLWALDQKIEINRQINQTLEQIAQTIFKSWFVDFEPVKAKAKATLTPALSQRERELVVERAAMCAISGKSESELDQLPPEQYQQLAATAALFPDELVESELGLIPEGWEVKLLAEIVQLVGGGTPKRSNAEYWDGEIPWFSVQDAPADGDVFVVNTEEKITKLGLEKSSTRLLPAGTTIISARGTVGRLALTGIEMAMNQSCYGVLGVDGVGPYFNYFNLKEAVSTLQQNTHGAVFDTITRQTFDTVSCVKPTKPILKRFEEALAPLMESIRNNLYEKNTLATLRSTLLHKLLSGEISIENLPQEATA